MIRTLEIIAHRSNSHINNFMLPRVLKTSKRFFAKGGKYLKKYSVSGSIVFDKGGIVFQNRSNNKQPVTEIYAPLESLLGSLCACSGLTAMYACKQSNIKLQSFNVVVAEGEVDTRGSRGDPHVKTRFESIKVIYEMKTDASQASLTELGHEVEKRCPVAVMLRDAGVRINAEWRKKH